MRSPVDPGPRTFLALHKLPVPFPSQLPTPYAPNETMIAISVSLD